MVCQKSGCTVTFHLNYCPCRPHPLKRGGKWMSLGNGNKTTVDTDVLPSLYTYQFWTLSLAHCPILSKICPFFARLRWWPASLKGGAMGWTHRHVDKLFMTFAAHNMKPTFLKPLKTFDIHTFQRFRMFRGCKFLRDVWCLPLLQQALP